MNSEPFKTSRHPSTTISSVKEEADGNDNDELGTPKVCGCHPVEVKLSVNSIKLREVGNAYIEERITPQVIIEKIEPEISINAVNKESTSKESVSPAASFDQAVESQSGKFTVIITDEEGEEKRSKIRGAENLNIKSNVGEKSLYDSVESKPQDLHVSHEHAEVEQDSGGGCLGSTASGSPGASLLLSSSSSSSNSSSTSPYRLTPDFMLAVQMHKTDQTATSVGIHLAKGDYRGGLSSAKEANGDFCPQINNIQIKLPPVPHEVMRTASERHQKGLMCPWIYQVLNHGEVKFEPSVQDENCSEFPNAVLFFQPIRQYIYAILFNLHHHTYMARKSKEDGQKATQAPDIKIKEWVYSKTNPYKTPLLVEAVPINWAVPTVQRLWFGSIIDDKKRRLRAFLSCVLSDSPLMLHTSYVPQHLLIMAVVLRYIMSFNEVSILRKQEIDAFLVTAFSPELTNAQYLQELQIPVVSSRGTQLASFFMVGVENALFANDACGSPIPWLMCCPWLFFDGKLFHSYLIKANCFRNLMELCDGDIELVRKVERCRHAILEGLHLNFLQTPPVPLPGSPSMPPPPSLGLSNSPLSYSGNTTNPSGGNNNTNSRGRSRGRGLSNGSVASNNNSSTHLYSRGGQLQVAGVVVGSWGPNYGRTNSKNSSNGYSTGMTDMYSGRAGNNGTIRNSRASANRGRPSVLAKRKTIKRKEVRPVQRGKPQLPAYNTGGYNHSENEIGNGVCDTSQLPQASNYSAYTNTSYSSYNTASAYPHTYHPEMPPPNPEPINLAPFHPHNQPHHHHHHHHHHNPYGTHSSGLKSPDSGVNVSILE